MKTNKNFLVASTLTLAVQGALVAMFAMPVAAVAADSDATALTPTNTVEIGVENTSRDSAKFGEYNGLNESGADLIGDFNVRGGDAYNSYEGGSGVNRWEIKGTDLGTTSRELSGNVSNQGHWDLGVGYDELRHNISDTYQTPLQGSMGGNNFTFPSNFGLINTDRNTVGTHVLTQDQLNAFHVSDVHTDRKNTSFTAGYNFDRQWGVKFDFNRLDQSGAKLISVGTDAAVGLVSGYNYAGEKNIMLMNPTNYQTDTYNLALDWKGDQAFLTASYYASLFHDNYNSVTWPNPFTSVNPANPLLSPPTGTPAPSAGLDGVIDALSTLPSNDFKQLNLTGGYTLSSTTKLAGGLSYGRNTQNESYPYAVMQAGGLPQNSLDALVVSKHADLKLTNQTTKDLVLTAGVKYNERDNRTASNTYNFYDLGGDAVTSVNAPMSNKKTQLELAGDYRIDHDHRVHLGYEYEGVKRWCNNSLANNAQGDTSSAPGYYTTSSCVQIPESTDNKLVVGYKLKAGEAVNFNAGYSYAKRKADVNSSFYNPMQAISEGFENLGFRAFFDASRTEQLAKAGVNWQANDRLSLSLNGRYVDDQYDDSPLGVQQGHTSSANLDATYSYSDTGAVSAYVSVQNRQRDMQDGSARLPVTVSTKIFTNQLNDDGTTVGLSARQKGLMGGKLELAGDLTYSLDKTGYSTAIPYAPTNGTCGLSTNLTCGSTPDIRNEMLRLKITGDYQVNKASKVALGYLFQKLKSNDYYYNAYQYGYTSTGLLPTNEQASNYSVNVVSATYIYSFK